MTIDKRRGGGPAAEMAQQASSRAFDTQVPDHVKTGAKVSGVTIGPAGKMAIPHKLGRKPVGWHTMRVVQSGPVAAAGSQLVETAADTNTITLKREAGTTGAFTYDIWVF
jgi:hypothetical protein